jgi:hypothetical protein
VKNRLVLIGAALVLSTAIACSDDAAKDQEPQPDSPLTAIASTSGTQSPPVVATALVSGVGPGISVADAIDSMLDGPLLVNGFVLAKGGDVRLCEGLLESFPAQCGTPYIVVDGVDLSGFDLTEASGVSWTAQPVQLLGEVSDGVFTVLPNVSASGTSMP